ncbi:MAG: PHP domain-containing protein [Anaerolineae bacterium]
MILVDLHVHSRYSADSLTPLSHIADWARRRGLGAIALTDHNTIAGALALAESAQLQVIIGEEIMTRQGEISGLFLQEQIPSDLEPLETVRLIHDQGGVVYVPHPYDGVRKSSLTERALLDILDEVDIVEVLNARVTHAGDNRNAEALANRHGLLCGAGSDAHQGFEIGRAHVCMPAFSDAGSFMASLALGTVRGRMSSPLVHVGSTYARLAKGLLSGQAFET